MANSTICIPRNEARAGAATRSSPHLCYCKARERGPWGRQVGEVGRANNEAKLRLILGLKTKGVRIFLTTLKGIRVLFSRRWEKVPCGKELADENRFGEFSSVYIGPSTPLTNPPTWPVKRVS